MASSSTANQIPEILHEEIEVDDPSEPVLTKELTIEEERLKYECNERFDDRDLFKVHVPGELELERENLINFPNKQKAHRFKTELEPEDVRLVNELGQLSGDQLMEYLRKIKDMSCGLGQAQEDQALRGKFMGIFKQ